MIKGCERRMIKIENTESELFEAAYFIVRQNAPLPKKCKKDDMLREAVRLTESRNSGIAFSSPSRIGSHEVLIRTAYFGAGVLSAALCSYIGFFI